MKTKMTVRDFIAQDIEIDVYDNVTDGIEVCFIGPMELTDEGEKHFKKLLDLDIEINNDPGWQFENAYVLIDDDDGGSRSEGEQNGKGDLHGARQDQIRFCRIHAQGRGKGGDSDVAHGDHVLRD